MFLMTDISCYRFSQWENTLIGMANVCFRLQYRYITLSATDIMSECLSRSFKNILTILAEIQIPIYVVYSLLHRMITRQSSRLECPLAKSGHSFMIKGTQKPTCVSVETIIITRGTMNMRIISTVRMRQAVLMRPGRFSMRRRISSRSFVRMSRERTARLVR